MPTTRKDLKPLEGWFAIFSRRGWWKISCYSCEAEWSLDKTTDLKIGSLLTLLNHAFGHRDDIRSEAIADGDLEA